MPDLKRQTDDECWCAVAGYEGLYEVSSFGRVRSFGRYRRGRGGCSVWREGRLLKQAARNGYLCVAFADAASAVTSFDVHRIVATAFCDGHFDGAHVNHKDGEKINNHFTNLEWLTGYQNAVHACSTGLTRCLTEVQVRGMCGDRERGMKLRELAEKYGTTTTNVHCIVTGKRYRWIDRDEPLAFYSHPGRRRFRCIGHADVDEHTTVSYWREVARHAPVSQKLTCKAEAESGAARSSEELTHG